MKTGIDNEKQTVEAMIRLYCRKRHGDSDLCGDCAELLEYAEIRLDKCLFGEAKPICKKCEIHCYAPEMRKRISEVMRFSGPRMLIYHPMLAIRHLFIKK